MNPEHIYIHAPFCARRCSYCDFAVTVDRSPAAGPWLAGIERELDRLMERAGWSRLDLRTIYIGGGTPSLFGTGVMPELARRLGRMADLSGVVEWTAEANPEHFGSALAADWRSAGINRLSLGAQTFDEGALEWMGRLHGEAGPTRAVEAARDAGFTNVSVDLIFGLPARFERDWTADLRKAVALGTEHISLYGLTAEPGAPLGRWVREGREQIADDVQYEAEYLEAAEVLGAAGFDHYEVSNFARPGRQSRHNQAYWRGVMYVGLGPAAHSSLPPRRWWNVRDHAEWALRIARDGTAVDGDETVTGEAAALEQAWLALRTSEGAVVRTERQRELAEQWRAAGFASIDGARVKLTRRGWLVLDRLAVEFVDPALNGDPTMLTLMGPTFETEACSTDLQSASDRYSRR